MLEVYIKGKKIRIKPSQSIGKGGEADVYDIGKGQALKIFKQPDHPDYQNLPAAQAAAADRLEEQQFKLRLFPGNLPDRVVQPQELATDIIESQILGYTMQLIAGAELLLKYSDRTFRQTSGITAQTVVQIFQDLHQTVQTIHQTGAIIGDFKDLNILVKNRQAYIIDADSFQLPAFPCRVFTPRFIDPLLCQKNTSQLILAQTYNPESDWYAFALMLMQCLLFVHPYGGVYKPKNLNQQIPHDARPLHRITIFHPEVKYPKPALPYKILPDELLDYFHHLLHQDSRGQFPPHLLHNLSWRKCPLCGQEHARTTCPICTQTIPISTPALTVVRGNVTATRIFATEGIILSATIQAGKLRWLYHHRGEFQREDHQTVFSGNLDPQLQIRLQGKSTIIAKPGQLITLKPGETAQKNALDIQPAFDANQYHHYWIDGGQLLRDGTLGAEYIGDVLPGQTRFWVGETFGFGFYRAGTLSVAFVFHSRRSGIKDSVKLPPFSGQIIDVNCTFTSERCWFFCTSEASGQTLHFCTVIRDDGTIEATTMAKTGDSSWLSNWRGSCAVGNFLFVPTDEGIYRIEVQNGNIVKTKEFPDTEPFIDANTQLFAGSRELYAVKYREIIALQIHA
ncbi:MAG TPA: hypothetical protein IGS52_00635 [Oscillatoriaceae cyanobacterium M33_DOE_052]|uniref:Protein kinase domain-containing protein n=1 Tax=Planktothricoides sp. SpSt-374 TaxID=2282167 RepID=A0A7C4A022_9CYAN|nr:hypothetical protein [Oscillatoriaceae cyanobacterium M33_DOE_052]